MSAYVDPPTVQMRVAGEVLTTYAVTALLPVLAGRCQRTSAVPAEVAGAAVSDVGEPGGTWVTTVRQPISTLAARTHTRWLATGTRDGRESRNPWWAPVRKAVATSGRYVFATPVPTDTPSRYTRTPSCADDPVRNAQPAVVTAVRVSPTESTYPRTVPAAAAGAGRTANEPTVSAAASSAAARVTRADGTSAPSASPAPA